MANGERIAECNGRVVKTYGDGVMAVFAEPADGISGAIAVQKGLEVRNHESPGTPVSAGVGITSGRVILTEADAFGHAVNLAKRLSDQAKGGQIVISSEVKERAGVDRVSILGPGPARAQGAGDVPALRGGLARGGGPAGHQGRQPRAGADRRQPAGH